MTVWRVVTDPFGKVIEITQECSGLKGILLILALPFILFATVGIAFAFAMDKIYEYKSNIITLFSIVTPLIIVLGRAKISALSSFLMFWYKFVIAPLFIVVMYTGIMYKTTWFDNIDYSSFSACLPFLLYLFLFPLICWYISYVLSNIVQLIAGLEKD
ncbi:hypothetical protein O0Q50_19750 [Priestia aryabhattai]|uniref:Uncharacterized protein n=1 Tax=Priestia aryabhattai TaxID=412384 RepID=A0AAX6NBX9_PRIAR|nr:hypothetical protein [Priestia aryabhattai]MDU9693411.1 hypothetical protein [Priestia aryabhattai]